MSRRTEGGEHDQSHQTGGGPLADQHLAETCDQAADHRAAELVRILDQHLAELKAGQAPSRTELIARHPALASQLEACLAGLEFIHGAESAPGRSQRVGDFRIIREVGRGGMGAVFEAEQISLGRKVALKILRFGGVSDPEAVERFQREAETVAKLHHTNIVPIFAVGSERGVNYYAMQFIDGKSLAEVLIDKKQPLAAGQVAEWGLQAAEALTHAHQRGVIHRDVKPSNLLLDKENRLWLTDFGLARRMDDVTLSMTGALLGTPRYMSPEQAVASKRKVDHRSDLFSLGATFYELLTNAPAFAGDTPHDVIQQILTGEPKPIRQINPTVPRDLETIVMKCLAKEPAQRYGAARDLADDLRAFLDGRPIRARRASLVELATRWFKTQQRSAQLMATAAVITLAVTFAFLFGWSGYDAWRQGTLKLGTNTPPLVAEVLDEQGHALRRETLPMQEAASLPAGDYQARINMEGSLSQTFDVSVQRASALEYSIDLRDERLLSLDITRSFAFTDLDKPRKSIVLLGNDGIALNGWQPAAANPRSAAVQKFPGFRWPWGTGQEMHSGFGVLDDRPWIAPRGCDLNGDGERDLICAGRHQAWLMAISGKDGSILWFAARGEDLMSAPQVGVPIYLQNTHSSTVFGAPVVDRDCDGDGVNDIVATIGDIGSDPKRLTGEQVAAKCWIEAISGTSGDTIWKYDLPATWFELPPSAEVPYQCRWFVGHSTGSSSQGRTTMRHGRHVHRRSGRVERTGTHAYRPDAAQPIAIGGSIALTVVAGTHVALIDPKTGQEVQPPLDLRDRPGRPVQWADMDGDRTDDVVLIGERALQNANDFPKARVAIWSVAKNAELWSADLDAEWPLTQGWTIAPPKWPLVADLNGDGKCEIAVPGGNSSPNNYFGSGDGTPWGIVSVRQGDSGKELWQRRLVTMDLQIDHMVAGPDIDRDGWREVYVTTLSGTAFRSTVDCLSGQSGRTLWTSSGEPALAAEDSHLAPPRWWNAGPDGWPQLLVEAIDDGHGSRQSVMATLSAGTGQMTRIGRGITTAEPNDIDNDGVEDLVVFDAFSDRLDFGGKLHVLRGVAREPWRKIGNTGEATADFDGDDVVDLVHLWGDGSIVTTSGRSGKLLWQVKLDSGYRCTGARSADADLDGDGTQDLLAWTDTSGPRRRSYPFHAISGKSGRVLWNAQPVDAQMVGGVLTATATDLDGDERPEVIFAAACDHGYPLQRESWSSHEVQLWLFVVSGKAGTLRWKQPLSRPFGDQPGEYLRMNTGTRVEPSIGDIDGDGTKDVIFPAVVGQGQIQSLETRVLSGRDGRKLWGRPFPMDSNQQESLERWATPAICDLDGDGKREVALVELNLDEPQIAGANPRYRVVLVRANDGSQHWAWNSAVHANYFSALPGHPRGPVLRPHVLAAGANRQRIGVFLPGSEGTVVVLDADGAARQCNVGHQSYVSPLWACDADRDGCDELVFLNRSQLIVAPADKPDQPLWTFDSGSSENGHILGIAPGGDEKSLVISFLPDRTDNTVLGFDAGTGQRVWTCPGVIPRADDSSYLLANQLAMLGGGEGELPFVYCAYAAVARCRQAAAVQSKAAAASQSLHGVTTAPAVLQAPAHDWRWQRNLPWVEEHISWRQGATFIIWGLFFSTFLVVIPAGYVVRLVWLRRFGLRTLLVLPIITGLFLTAVLLKAPLDNDFATVLGRLSIGLILAPAAVGIALLVWWSISGQWRRAALWLTISVVITLVCAAVALRQSQQYRPLLAEESYDWTGWYLIWFAGAYMTAWVAIVVLPLKYAVLKLRAWWRSCKAPAAEKIASAVTIAATGEKSARALQNPQSQSEAIRAR